MKAKILFSLIFLSTIFVFGQICPKNYSVTFDTQLETANLQDGSIEITSISGGTAPYRYFWNNGERASLIEDLSSGNYSLTILDTNNCSFRMCVWIDKDSLPCNYTFKNLTCGDTLSIEETLVLEGKPNQTGVLVEFYDENTNLLSSFYTDVRNNNNSNNFNILIGDNYYNQFVRIVTKGVFGSDTSEFCGDTCFFTIENFRCDLNFVESDTLEFEDTIAINHQFNVRTEPYLTGIIFEVYDEFGNLIDTCSGTFIGGTTYFAKLQSKLYYNERFIVTYRTVYSSDGSNRLTPSTDTLPSCDTARFTVANFSCDHAWTNCQDTVRANHVFNINKGTHGFEAWVDLLDARCNLIGTYPMDYYTSNPLSSNFGFYNPGLLDPDSSYKLVVTKVYRYPDTVNYNWIDTVFSCGDTCEFTIESVGSSRVKSNQIGLGVSSALSSSVQLYPNPVNNRMNLRLNPEKDGMYIIRIFNIKGQLDRELTINKPGQEIEINTSDLSEGIHFLHIQQAGEKKEVLSFSVIH